MEKSIDKLVFKHLDGKMSAAFRFIMTVIWIRMIETGSPNVVFTLREMRQLNGDLFRYIAERLDTLQEKGFITYEKKMSMMKSSSKDVYITVKVTE